MPCASYGYSTPAVHTRSSMSSTRRRPPMAPSPSPRPPAFRMWLTGVVTPPRAALVALSVVSLAALWIGWRAGQTWLMVGAFCLLALIVAVVALRFGLKGPELDRALPVVHMSQTPLGQAVHIANVDPGMMESFL